MLEDIQKVLISLTLFKKSLIYDDVYIDGISVWTFLYILSLPYFIFYLRRPGYVGYIVLPTGVLQTDARDVVDRGCLIT